MFFMLLLSIVIMAWVVSFVIVSLFKGAILSILNRIINDSLTIVLAKYFKFVLYVIGISNGVRIWQIEKYITPNHEGVIIELTKDRWILEFYHTILGSLRGMARVLLFFFVTAVIAFVIVRIFESKKEGRI
ncbi:MAG: hypothetical protein GY817_08570 [bacterium]|nr:hypothetical protein [bacterium]